MLPHRFAVFLRQNQIFSNQIHGARRFFSRRSAVPPPLVFCFDIVCVFKIWFLIIGWLKIFLQDGVLIRGPNVLPAAKRALAILEGDNPFGWCVSSNCQLFWPRPYSLLCPVKFHLYWYLWPRNIQRFDLSQMDIVDERRRCQRASSLPGANETSRVFCPSRFIPHSWY